MKKFLKISLFCIFIGLVMIILFSTSDNESFISTLSKLIISPYKSGMYSNEDIAALKTESIANENTKVFFIHANDLDIETTDKVSNITVQYYNLPNVKIEITQQDQYSYSANFNYNKYELVFNREIEKYKKVKVLVPKDLKLEIFLVSAENINLDGINATRMLAIADYDQLGTLNMSNVNSDELQVHYHNIINVKDSNIKSFSTDFEGDINFNLENVNGNSLVIGNKYESSNEYLYNMKANITLKNSFFDNQGYYSKELNVNINNNKDISEYYFKLNTLNLPNVINMVNDKEYDLNYESNNLESSNYKIKTRSQNLNLKIK